MADVREFRVPDLGEGLEDAQIVQWHVTVGETVELNQDVCEVETAKALVGIPSPFAGTVVERFGDVGETVNVGSPLLRVEVSAVGGEAAPADRERPEQTSRSSELPTRPDTKRESVLVGYGADQGAGPLRRRVRPPGQTGVAVSSAEPSLRSRALAKPPVRKLAKDLSVDLDALAPGSGPEGSITRDDVQAAAAPTRPGATSASTDSSPRPGQRIPLRGIRARIAEKMVISRREIPQATCSITIGCRDLLALAKDLSVAPAQEPVKVTPLALILKATAVALARHPEVNSRLDTDAHEIVLLEDVNLGVAMDTSRGLIVPVIKNADRLSTLETARELTRLVEAARSGSVRPSDLTGGTFTVNNYGALGTEEGEPIINHPEAAILGIGAIRERPWVVDGQLVVLPIAKLTLAFDHRIFDGGSAARFLSTVGDFIERPSRLLLHL